jgi:alpha-galactosidase
MPDRATIRRRTALLLMGSAFVCAGPVAAAVRLAGGKPLVIGDGHLAIEFDQGMHSRLLRSGVPLTGFDPSEALRLEGGHGLDRFTLLDHAETPVSDEHGAGRRHVLRGIAAGRAEKQLTVTFYDLYPGVAILDLAFRNIGTQPLTLSGWHAGAHVVLPQPGGAWSFSGASYPNRRDWVQPVGPRFDQRNFMGMNGSDYGGGTPVAVVWRRNGGLAVGHIETVPKLVALPITATAGGTRIAMEGDAPITIAPGETFTTPRAFVMAHDGDHFRALDAYRRIMAERGLAAPAIPDASYEPIWCAWGYERNFTTQQIYDTLPKAKSLGLSWAVLDDGWQTSEGDWKVDRTKFPRGDADMRAFADRVKTMGMRPRLWFTPLAVDPGTDLLHDHVDMLLLDKSGAVQNVTWWNSFTMCPAYPPTVEYFRKQVRRIIGEWGYEGLKLDGQHLNGVAPCYNPAHNHARPEESFEKLQDFWKALYDTAIAINPDAVIEICPCGDSFAFHNIPAMNNTPASDPESSWQVRLKGKTFKALMGPSAPYSGDHVELSDRHDDFASSYGVGAILSTKFTWPHDTDRPSDTLPPGGFVLTPAREKLWRKWIALYRENMLPKGQYRGDLYDIGFDKPEAHAVAAGGRLHYAFFADRWRGPVELRGLGKGRYALTDAFTGRDLGTASGRSPVIQAAFEHFLLIQAKPIEEQA